MKQKKCKYFNKGRCKYVKRCRNSHPTEICSTYLGGGKCDQSSCQDRHPKICKWWLGRSGCRRNDCNYLHVTLAHDDDQQKKAHTIFPCAGCKSRYDDQSCVVQHIVNDTTFLLCLNCDDWIQHKDMIITPGWTLFDGNGALRYDV